MNTANKEKKAKYSVLLPLIADNGEWYVLFEVRSGKLNAHAGEISFPGGAIEPGEDIKAAAIRETSEELGIDRSEIKVLASIRGTKTLGGNSIYCHLGVLDTAAASLRPSEAEVASLLYVPLNHLLEHRQIREILSTKSGKEIPSYRYEYMENQIWGITGRLVKNFLDSYTQIRESLENTKVLSLPVKRTSRQVRRRT